MPTAWTVACDAYGLGPHSKITQTNEDPHMALAMKRKTNPTKLTSLNFKQLEVRRVLSGNAHLVMDINTAPFTGHVDNITQAAEAIYFTADTPSSGIELWRTDGTDSGTWQVRDIRPGTKSSLPQDVTAVGDVVFFTADDGNHGRELWSSDGSEAGTVRLTDFASAQSDSFSIDPQFTQVGDQLFFLANSGVGRSVWSSNGTVSGTRLLREVSSSKTSLATDGSQLYLSIDDELWNSDGTPGGTAFVAKLPDNSWLAEMHVIDDSIFFFLNKFFGSNPEPGAELWRTDGTEGGTNKILTLTATSVHQSSAVVGDKIVASLGSGQVWSSDGTETGTSLDSLFSASITSFVEAGEQLYFVGWKNDSGRELWKTDGTRPGTELIKDIHPGTTIQEGSSREISNSSLAAGAQLVATDDTLYFYADDGVSGRELWKSDGTSAGTLRVKDVRNGSESSQSSNTPLAVLTNTVYFAANDGTGIELWKSDGTTDGTMVVKDINTGTQPSAPKELTAIGDSVYFTATTDEHELLWKSDGTEAGTVMLKELPFESLNEYGGVERHDPISQLTRAGEELHFVVNGRQYWKTDGTSGGTVQVPVLGTYGSHPDYLQRLGEMLIFSVSPEADFFPEASRVWRTDGSEGGTVAFDFPFLNTATECYNVAIYGPIVEYKGQYYFSLNIDCGGDHPGTELWVSDGTESGTTLFKDLIPGTSGSAPSNLTVVEDSLFFTAFDKAHNRLLWKSDGTADGTSPVMSAEGFRPRGNLIELNGVLYFVADDDGADGGRNLELWRSDGTTAGTFRLRDINVGKTGSYPQQLTALDDALIFIAEGTNGLGLWRSDGTAEGTVQLRPIAAGAYPKIAISLGAHLYFTMNENEVWRTDGSVDGTTIVASLRVEDPDRNCSTCFVGIGFTGAFEAIGNTMYFGYDNGLWRTDGTQVGTNLVHKFDWAGSGVTQLASQNDILYFNGVSAATGRELWMSDGTSEGTLAIRDIRSGTTGSNPSNFRVVGDLIYFTADDGLTGPELWKTDGTEVGTMLVREINSNFVEAAVQNLTSRGERTVFSAVGDSCESLGCPGWALSGLWTTDGTLGGTSRIDGDFRSGRFNTVSGFFTEFLQFEDTTIFVRQWIDYNDERAVRQELWRIDGATAQKIADLVEEPNVLETPPSPSLKILNGTVFFAAQRGETGRELWKSEGTVDGTGLVKDIAVGTNGSLGDDPQFTAVGSNVYFVADDGVSGSELWISDGTETGTRLVADLAPGTASSVLSELTTVRDRMFFTVLDKQHGRELWTSDGTAAGTSLVVDIAPGADSSNPSNLQSIQDVLYFSGFDSEANADVLWQSDGTAEGTQRVEVQGTPLGAGEFVLANDRIFFTASSSDVGRELWVMELSDERLAGDADGDGSVDFADFLVLSANFGRSADVAFADGDFDEDGEVDFADFLLLSANFGIQVR